MSRRALFEGLIRDTADQAVEVALVGDEVHYVVDDAGFKFHIPAENVDRQVLRQLGDQMQANRDLVTEGTLKMLGRDDLFTKAAVDASLNNLDANFDQLIERGLPEEARGMLGLLGFRVVINYHGEVVRVDQPTGPAPEPGDE